VSVEGGGQRVVYVDDDEIMNLMVDRLLSRSGYRVKAFQDPRLAVDYVGRHPDAVDLVVTDFNMPGMTGLDVARAVNALPGVVPVIIATGYISDELVTQADALGVRALLQKENTLEELGGLVRQILSAHVDLAGEGRATS
jgi:CheY-like chemotaxis protein